MEHERLEHEQKRIIDNVGCRQVKKERRENTTII